LSSDFVRDAKAARRIDIARFAADAASLPSAPIQPLLAGAMCRHHRPERQDHVSTNTSTAPAHGRGTLRPGIRKLRPVVLQPHGSLLDAATPLVMLAADDEYCRE
jgi:hypothetical protein